MKLFIGIDNIDSDKKLLSVKKLSSAPQKRKVLKIILFNKQRV